MKKKRPPLREIDGVRWIAVNIAAQYARKKSDRLREHIASGDLPAFEIDGVLHVQYAALNRLIRDWEVPKPPTTYVVGSHSGRPGPLSAHREKQMPLPMDIGRRGKGWLPE